MTVPAPVVLRSDTRAAHTAAGVSRIVALVARAPLATLTPATRLGDDLGLDSLGRVELATAIEGELGVVIDEGMLGSDTTIAELGRLIAAGAPIAPGPALPAWPRTPLCRAVRGGLQTGLIFPLLRPVCQIDCTGQAHLRDLDEPVLLVANHGSHLDTLVLLAALPSRLRGRTAVAAAADYFFSRAWRGAAVGLLGNAFPFDRTGATRATLQACARLVDAGWSLLIYPEGTRSTTGQIAPFRHGIGLLAVTLAMPVVPVRLRGVDRVLPKGSRRPRPGRVHVAFGAPLRFAAHTPAPAATRAIEMAVRAL